MSNEALGLGLSTSFSPGVVRSDRRSKEAVSPSAHRALRRNAVKVAYAQAKKDKEVKAKAEAEEKIAKAKVEKEEAKLEKRG